jgi:hypothetical protein
MAGLQHPVAAAARTGLVGLDTGLVGRKIAELDGRIEIPQCAAPPSPWAIGRFP